MINTHQLLQGNPHLPAYHHLTTWATTMWILPGPRPDKMEAVKSLVIINIYLLVFTYMYLKYISKMYLIFTYTFT